jgi:putative NADH-flavin reductase
MRITVFGASGRTGTQIVRQALGAGHHVVAVVRDPSRLEVPGRPELRVVRASVTDPEAIRPAVENADAVVSALGPRGFGPTTVLSDGVRSILQAMDKTGVRRLIVISANGAYPGDEDGPFTRLVLRPLLQRMLRNNFADTHRMDDEVRASGTDWTIMRPPQLTKAPRSGRYRTAIDRHIGRRISRADLADAILNAAGDPATFGHALGVAY